MEIKDKTLRTCIDYRGLNDITSRTVTPSTFQLLKVAMILTKLDLHTAYHLGRIREVDKWKTTLKTPMEHYEYLVMPFGRTLFSKIW